MRSLILSLVIFIALTTPIFGQSPETLTGTLDADKPFYEYPIPVTEDNTTIIADVVATSGDLDTILYLLDSAGNILSQNDNRTREDLGAYIEYPSADVGAYILIVARYALEDGETSGDFSLTINTSPTITELPPYDLSTQALDAAGYPILAPQAPAEWTVLVYYGADTDLEEALIVDLKEFELAGGSSEGMNIIAFIDRSPDYSTVSDDWSGAKIYAVTANTADDSAPMTINSQEIATLGAVDSGDGLTLAQFVAWGIRHYPANHYALAFGSHGAGWAGVITDDGAGSIITLPELDHAMRAVNQPFELVINDACLMSSAEYHSVMARYFSTSFASPEVVVDPALNMTLFVDSLRENLTTDTLTLVGSALIDRYIDLDVLLRPGSDNNYMTNAITDLTQFGAVEEAIEAFSQLVLTDPLRYSPTIGAARSNAYTYSAFLNGASLIDLGSFMRQIIVLADDDRLIASAQAVIRALEAGVVYSRGGEKVADRVLYQNIYFPEKAKNFENAYFIQSPLTGWGAMLRAYYNSLTPKTWTKGDIFHPPTPPQVAITTQYPPTPSIINPVRMDMEVIGRNIARGIFTVDQALPTGGYERLIEAPILEQSLDEAGNVTLLNSWGSGVELATFGWDVLVSQLTDGEISRNVLTRDANETTAIEGRYRADDTDDWRDIIVIFGDDPTSDALGRVTRVVSRDPQSDALGVVTIPAGAHFQVYTTLVADNGKTHIVPDETHTFIWGENGLSLIWAVPAPSGDYNLGFLIQTFGGEETLTIIPTTISNDNLDTHLRGYTDTNWGYTLVLDNAVWYTPIETEFGYTEAPSYDEAYIVRIYPQTAFSPDATVDELLVQYNLTLLDQQTVTINDQDITLITYGDDSRLGVGAFYATPDGYAILVGLESDADADTQALAEQVIGILETLTLFNVDDLSDANTALWDRRIIGATTDIAIGANYYIPRSWRLTLFEDGIWVGATPAAADNPRTATPFYRLAQVEAYDAVVLRDAILTDYLPNATITQRRTYYAQFNTWQVAEYTDDREGIAVTGRVYATIGDFSHGHVFWQEAPAEIAPTLFSQVFEPMIDAFRPNKPLRSYPLDDYGMVIQYRRNWNYMQSADDNRYIITESPDKTLQYVVEFYPETNDTDDILAQWLDTTGYTLQSDPQETAYNGKTGVIVAFDGADDEFLYSGYAFITTSSDDSKGMVFYLVARDIQATQDEFDSLMSFNDYGISADISTTNTEFTYARGLFEAIDSTTGLGIVYPNAWGDITVTDNIGNGLAYATLTSPSGGAQLNIYVESSADLQKLLQDVYDYDNVTLTSIGDVTIDGTTGQRYALTHEIDGTVQEGVVVAFIGQNGFSYALEFLGDGRGDFISFLDEFIANITTQSPVYEADEVQILLNDYTNDELGLSFGVPEGWYEPVYEDNLITVESDEGVYVYVYIADEIMPLEEMAELVLETYGMEQVTVYESLTMLDTEAIDFQLAYDDFVGVAFVTVVNGRTIMFSVEGESIDDVLFYYYLLKDSVRFETD